MRKEPTFRPQFRGVKLRRPWLGGPPRDANLSKQFGGTLRLGPPFRTRLFDPMNRLLLTMLSVGLMLVWCGPLVGKDLPTPYPFELNPGPPPPPRPLLYSRARFPLPAFTLYYRPHYSRIGYYGDFYEPPIYNETATTRPKPSDIATSPPSTRMREYRGAVKKKPEDELSRAYKGARVVKYYTRSFTGAK